ncbi:MAG: hypothetical protein ACE5JG_12695, partial [Planctomycetota bacterium]
MRLDISLSQKLSLQLKLAPQIIQSIEILQLPALSLQELIEQALDENEALERAEETQPETAVAAEQQNGSEAAEKPAAEGTQQREADDLADTLQELDSLEAAAERDWEERGGRRIRRTDEDPKLEALQNTAAPSISLRDSLYEQFLMLEPDETVRVIGRHLIYNLGEGGLLPYPLEEILESPELRGRYTREDAERALRTVQSLEPRGVGGRDLREVLLLQLDPDDPRVEVKRRLIQQHLLDINKNKRPKVAREIGITIAELNDLVAEISRLDPRPGAKVSRGRNPYIHPDVVVE